MTRLNSFLTIFYLFINMTTICGQAVQIGIIDFYGSNSDKALLRKCLPFTENDTIQFLTEDAYPNAKKAIVACLLGQPGIRQADIAFICCDEKEGKWMVFIGIDSTAKVSIQSHKTDDIKLPDEIKSTYDSLMNLVLEAVEKGEAAEYDSSGYTLMRYLPARALEQKAILYANSHLELLRKVLNHSKYSEQREVASAVITYHKDKKAIVKDLLNAVSDPDEIVRNNAVRAIGSIADYSQIHPDLHIEIPADPFIDLINSISWTDRNKSSFVLLSLTNSRNQALLNQIKKRSLDPIVDMAKWKDKGHAMTGYVLLGRIAGWPDKEIMDGANGDRLASIEKMLTSINH